MFFICTPKPRHYAKQHFEGLCGFFSIKSVIEAYYPDTCHLAVNYTDSRFHRIIRLSLPRELTRILRMHKIQAECGRLKEYKTQAQIDWVKRHLHKGPLILMISHAYNQRNRFNLRRALIKQHYISVRGYDDEKEVFYCYDSHTDIHENNLPVGNLEIPYADLVSYRELAGLGLFAKRYIAIAGKG